MTAAPAARASLSLAELAAWGERFGREANAPLVVAISGELGAGKTTLAKAICRGAGVTQEVTSPTFALVHEYEAPRFPVYHLDLYRLERPQELTNLAWEEIVNARALVLVEWPERAGTRLPREAVRLLLEHDPAHPDRRTLVAGR